MACNKGRMGKYNDDPLNFIPDYAPHFKFLNVQNGNPDLNEIEIQGENRGFKCLTKDHVNWNQLIEKTRYPVYNYCYYHFSGTFTEKFELENFPFDVQDLQISIECEDDCTKAIFVPNYKAIDRDSWMGWVNLKYSALQEYIVHPMFIEYDLLYSGTFSCLNMRLKIERKYGIYFWNIAVKCTCIKYKLVYMIFFNLFFFCIFSCLCL